MRQPVTELTNPIRTVEKISLDSPGIVGEVADFGTSLATHNRISHEARRSAQF